MDGCRALVPRRSLEYEDLSDFRRCRSLLQKIGFVLDKWEESVGEHFPRVSRQELSVAEKCLNETEKKLWKLLASQMANGAITGVSGQSTAVANYAPDKRPMNTQVERVQREVVARHSSPHNQLVRVQRSVQVQNVAVQHTDAAQAEILPTINNQQIQGPKHLVNLLVDWYLTLEPPGLYLEGVLLNEGQWKTSPIVVRVGPTTVKTESGTTYNISGEMHLREGVQVPDFIYKKFRRGFPSDWQIAVSKWAELLKNINRPAMQQNDAMPKKDAEHIQNPMKLQQAASNNKALETDLESDQNKMPPPSLALKRSQSKEGVMGSKVHSLTENVPNADKAPVNRNVTRTASPKARRCSNRVLMKSLTDLSMNSSNFSLNSDMSVDVNSLKKWGAEYIQETGELVLVGQLVSDINHHVIDRNFASSNVTRRIQADLVETDDREVYRLLGPAQSSEKKFMHGFPLRWKEYLRRQQFPVRATTTNAKASRRLDTFAEKPATSSQNIGKNSPQISRSNSSLTSADKRLVQPSASQQKRTSQMIQQLVRHNIKQSQSSTFNSTNNESLMSKKHDSKRKNKSLLPLQPPGPAKKIRSEDGNQAGALRNHADKSEVNVSSQSSQNSKQSRALDPSAGKDKRAEREISVMQTSQVGNHGTNKKSTIKSRLNNTSKCLVGMASDVGIGEFNFNIF